MCKSHGLLDHLDQQKCKLKKYNYGNCMHVDCTSGFGRQCVKVSLVVLVLAAG